MLHYTESYSLGKNAPASCSFRTKVDIYGKSPYSRYSVSWRYERSYRVNGMYRPTLWQNTSWTMNRSCCRLRRYVRHDDRSITYIHNTKNKQYVPVKHTRMACTAFIQGTRVSFQDNGWVIMSPQPYTWEIFFKHIKTTQALLQDRTPPRGELWAARSKCTTNMIKASAHEMWRNVDSEGFNGNGPDAISMDKKKKNNVW